MRPFRLFYPQRDRLVGEKQVAPGQRHILMEEALLPLGLAGKAGAQVLSGIAELQLGLRHAAAGLEGSDAHPVRPEDRQQKSQPQPLANLRPSSERSEPFYPGLHSR